MVDPSNYYLFRAAKSTGMSSMPLRLNEVCSMCLHPHTIRRQIASLNASTRPSSRRLPLTLIHATKPTRIISCLLSSTRAIHPYKYPHGSTIFEHSIGTTLGSHQNCPLTSIPNLPTGIMPLGGSISNRCSPSFDKLALETCKSHSNARSGAMM